MINTQKSYLVHFGPNRSILSYFSPLWFYFVHLIHFIPFSPFVSTSVHLCQFLWTYIQGKDMFGLRVPILNPTSLKKKI